MGYNVAIDGPAGAGKSTIAKKAAKKLDFIYVDTGAMYRAIALYFIRNRVAADDEKTISEKCSDINVSIDYADGVQQVILNGENVNDYIRTEQVSMMTSSVSKYPAVREKLLNLQRQLATEKNVIMDGRDIGTCVLPDAKTKIFLTASAGERARRRYKEQVERGIECDIKQIEKDIIARDEQDMNREIAPLKQAEDAVLIDSSDMSIEQVVDAIIDVFEKTK